MGKDFLADIPGVAFQARIGSNASIASNGAGAILHDTAFIAPFDLKVLSFFRRAHANEVTKGTATSSASYRRYNLVNGSTDGAGTVIMASLNHTASLAAAGTRAGATTASNTLAAGHQMFVSHLTVGAATADGTNAEDGTFHVVYQRL